MKEAIKIVVVLIVLTINGFSQPIVNNGLALTIESGVSVTFQGGYTNQTSGASLGTIDNAGTINVTGNWTNNSANTVFSTVNGTTVFLDNVVQTIGGTNSTGFNNLSISNAAGVTLNKAVTVAGVLTLSSGLFTTTTTNLLTMNSGSSVGAVSNTSFVSGPVAKIGSANFIFPVGKDALYRPIAVSTLSGSETFTAQYFHFNPNAANAQDAGAPYSVASKDVTLNHIGAKEYWILNRAGAQNAFVTLSWDSYSGGVDNLADLTVARWDAGTTKWKDQGNGGTTGAIDPATGTVISGGLVTSFSPFTLASTVAGADPLPLELLTFNATPDGKVVDIKWSTATEINLNYFVVQRSKNASVFEDVTQVKAYGNSSTTKNYFAVDYKPYDGVSYYRLKPTNNDGSFNYSNIDAVEFDANGTSLDVYPIPSAGDFNISFQGTKGEEVLLVVRDVLGQEFYSKAFVLDDTSSIQFVNLSDKLASGIYMVVASSDEKVFEKKIVVVK